MKGGTPLQFDPVSRRLLLTVIREQQREAHPALVDAVSLQLQEVLPIAVEQPMAQPLRCTLIQLPAR